jgi:hypothetical protein
LSKRFLRISKKEMAMLTRTLAIKKTTPEFQILFMRNDSSQEVEVHEVKNVDFMTVQEHLKRGESVFITTKKTQKLSAPRQKCRSLKTRLVTAFSVESS